MFPWATRVAPLMVVGFEPVVADAQSYQDVAFERYVLPELDVLGRVALSMTRDAADAEDLVQDTLIRAYGAIERFDGRYPRAWLLTILRNTQRNRVRRKRPELFRDVEAGEHVLESSSPSAASEDQVVDQLFDAAVSAAFNDLPDRFRPVVEMVDLGGLSYAEAAEALDIPIGTVMSRLHRARGRIRKQLDHASSDEGGPAAARGVP